MGSESILEREQSLTDLAGRELLAHQNRVRGDIARFKSRGYKPEARSEVREFRNRLRASTYSAKTLLDIDDYSLFLRWLEDVLAKTAPNLASSPVGFDYLGGFPRNMPRTSLEREILWAATLSNVRARQLTGFRQTADRLTEEILSGRWDSAFQISSTLTSDVGESFWLIQIRIALTQRCFGLEGQKEYISSLRKQFTRGLLSFLSFFTGVRNEGRSSWGRYHELIQERLKKSAYDDHLRAYILYRLTNVWPDGEAGINAILRHEHSHSIIDVYETLISLLQELCEPDRLHLRPLAIRALNLMGDVRDFRLDKLALFLGVDRPYDLEFRPTEVSDATISGSGRLAAIYLRRSSPSQDADPWNIIYSGIIAAHRRRSPKSDGDALGLKKMIASTLARDPDCLNSLGQLEKLTNNFDGLPPLRALKTALRRFRSHEPTDCFQFGIVCLNSRFVGIEDLANGPVSYVSAHSPVNLITRAVWAPDASNSHADEAGPAKEAASLSRAFEFIKQNAFEDAASILTKLVTHGNSVVIRNFSASALLICRRLLGDNAALIALVAEEASKNEMSPALMPVQWALGDLSWAEYKPFAGAFSVMIALDTLWRSTEDDAVATMLRFAFAYHLKQSGRNRPSEFADSFDEATRKVLVYYLRYVCIPSVMDMSRAFKTSRQVIEERQAVFAALKILDPANSEAYDGEIYSIANNLVIADGLKLVDSSRIHVDTYAISRWARRGIAEDYARYVDLIEAGVGSHGDFDELLREIFAKVGARQIFYTPDDQADGLLVDMLDRVREQFLTNSDYGLDYYLSKRVRHQSFVGLVRGPLEFSNLITTRESEFGSYRPNAFWIDKFNLPENQSTELSKAFSEFSDLFDTTVTSIRDQKFQIKGPEAPDGLFDIVLTSQMLFVIRELMQLGFAFDEFLRVIYQLFWAALEPSLTEARNSISLVLKSEITDLFTELRESVRRIAEHNPAFPEFSTTVGDVSVMVQRSLDQASAWFVKPEGQQAGRQFTLQQSIDIAVNSAQISHRAFNANIVVEVVGNVDLLAPDLLVLTDAIFIALDNVKRHSATRSPPNVTITCIANEVSDILNLEVVSDVNSANVAAISKKLIAIRNLIGKGELGKRARKEGGSGFLKLASALRQSAEGNLVFEITDNAKFRLALSFRPSRLTVALIAV